ncbi:class I SAM-dependent methyltransferase [Actinopolymorpha sp. B11F2]|uniref:class I SAM-dependent methyltransferase n=1 Tax=Actinopolymorpha sp. B11F2 TaxID=3160862 RepID=UPI0032E45125
MTTDHAVSGSGGATVSTTPSHDVLIGEAYADNSRLAARVSIYDWQRPRLDLVGLALARLGDVGGPVLDVGWGTGAYTSRLRATRPDLRVVPVDLSAGMRPEVVGEVDRLPFSDGSAGGALAMHMLYYATDPRAALAELRRVLRSGGRLVASTNAHDDKAEMGGLWQASLRDLGIVDPPAYSFDDRRFSLDVGIELVRQVFGTCEVQERRYRLVVPEVAPVLAYVDSTRDLARHLPPSVSWADYRGAAECRIRAEIERTGAFHVTGHMGILAATA